MSLSSFKWKLEQEFCLHVGLSIGSNEISIFLNTDVNDHSEDIIKAPLELLFEEYCNFLVGHDIGCFAENVKSIPTELHRLAEKIDSEITRVSSESENGCCKWCDDWFNSTGEIFQDRSGKSDLTYTLKRGNVAKNPATIEQGIADVKNRYDDLFSAAVTAAKEDGWGAPKTHDDLVAALKNMAIPKSNL